MILLLICNAFSLQIYDFCNNPFPVYFNLLFEPNDRVEIRINSKIGTLFDQWNKNLVLNVDLIKSNQITKSYGPFDYKKHLIAVYFIRHNYSLKFVNEGKDAFSLKMLFTQGDSRLEYYKDENDRKIYTSFPIFHINDYIYSLSIYKKHFIYDNDHRGSKKSLIWMGVLLSLGTIISLAVHIGN